MWSKALFVAIALSVSAPALAPAHAQIIEPGYMIPVQNRSQNIISARDAIEAVRARYGGQPLGSPRLEQSGDRAFYVISWRFPNELVREVRVDAVTGQVR